MQAGWPRIWITRECVSVSRLGNKKPKGNQGNRYTPARRSRAYHDYKIGVRAIGRDLNRRAVWPASGNTGLNKALLKETNG